MSTGNRDNSPPITGLGGLPVKFIAIYSGSDERKEVVLPLSKFHIDRWITDCESEQMDSRHVSKKDVDQLIRTGLCPTKANKYTAYGYIGDEEQASRDALDDYAFALLIGEAFGRLRGGAPMQITIVVTIEPTTDQAQ
jgi:hypothetical protein